MTLADQKQLVPMFGVFGTVLALQIRRIEFLKGGATILHFELQDYEPVMVDQDFVRRHCPAHGGYFVTTCAGSNSYIPEAAFADLFVPKKGESKNEQSN